MYPIYNEALKQSLNPLELSPHSVLIQFVDYRLLAAPSRGQCKKDTVRLICHLTAKGHKVSLDKLQFVEEQVRFLEHVIFADGKLLDPDRVQAIQQISKPVMKKQMMTFLGICFYFKPIFLIMLFLNFLSVL